MKESDYIFVQSHTRMRAAYDTLRDVAIFNPKIAPILAALQKEIDVGYKKLEAMK